MQLARFLCPFKDEETEAQTPYMTYGWSHSHQVPRFQTLCWQSCHLHPQAWLLLNTLMSLGKIKGKTNILPHPWIQNKGVLSPSPVHPWDASLISYLIQSFPFWGAWTYSPKPSPRVSFPSLPWWSTDPQPARRAEGVDVGLIVPVQILWTSILLSSISGLLLKGTWHLHFQAFSEILQQTSTSWPPSLQAPRFLSLDQQSSY